MRALPIFYETNTEREIPVPVEIDVSTAIVGNPDPESGSLWSQRQGYPAPKPRLVRLLVLLAVLPQVGFLNGVQDQVHGHTCAQGMADTETSPWCRTFFRRIVTGSSPSFSAASSMLDSSANKTCGTPKPRNAPQTPLLVNTAQPSWRVLGTRYR